MSNNEIVILDAELITETDLARRLDFAGEVRWCPKSVVTPGEEDGKWRVPYWFAKKEGLI